MQSSLTKRTRIVGLCVKAELLQIALVSRGCLDAWEGVQVSEIAPWPLICSGMTKFAPARREWPQSLNRTRPLNWTFHELSMPYTANVRIVEPDGRQLWVDVKMMSTKPHKPIKHSLCQVEVAKCKQYGQGPPQRSIPHRCVFLRWLKLTGVLPQWPML